MVTTQLSVVFVLFSFTLHPLAGASQKRPSLLTALESLHLSSFGTFEDKLFVIWTQPEQYSDGAEI